jgi:phenylacetate-CoA ligase
VAVGSTPADLERLGDVSAATLGAAGVGPTDRVLVTLTSDGVAAGPLLTRAAVTLGATAGSVSARGRTRVIRALRSLRATTLITTPCGAADLLARIFIEFGLQPEDLGLERILVGGEIPSPGTLRQIGDEFDCDVRRLLLDPFTGAALAQGVDQFELTDTGLVACAVLDRDDLAPVGAGGMHEIVVRAGAEADAWLRSGEVVVGATAAETIPMTSHTVGDHVLGRGRWLSLPAIDRALAGIDGIAGRQLDVSREGTLDRVVVVVTLDRPALVDDAMWAGRIREAIESVVPVRVETRAVGADGEGADAGDPVVDHRGHHLGIDRETVAGALAAR